MPYTQRPLIWSILKWGLVLLSGLAFLGYGALALGTVPAPSAETAEQITGRISHIGEPHPEYGDLTITLDDGRGFYVNRAPELSYFEWEAFVAEVGPGDEVTLTAVSTLADRWFGLAPPLKSVAGVQTAEKIYMDPATSAERWTFQATFARNALIAGGLLFASLLLSIAYRPSPPPLATA